MSARLFAAFRPPLRVVRGTDSELGRPADPPGGRGLRRGLSALRHGNFRRYWLGQVVSLVGAWMQSVSQPWLVLLLGGTPLQLGAVIALQFAPAMVLAPLGGVMADRIDKRRMLLVAQAVAMCQAAVLFGLTVTGVVEIWHVFVLAGVLGVVNAVEMPVRQSFTADLVPREDLVNAIALSSTSFNLARVVGPAIAGLTLAAFGPAFNFGINTVTYIATLAGLASMDPALISRPERPTAPPSVLTSLAEGVRYARRTPEVLWPLVLLGGLATFGMNFQTLLPLFARDTLRLGAEGYGLLFAVMGAGSLAGSLILAFGVARRPMLSLMLGGAVTFIIFEALLGLSRAPLLAYSLAAAVGLSSMLMVNTINVTIQQHVPNELRGRVMSLYVTVFAGSAPFGGFFAGAVAQVWGAPAGFLLGAAISTTFIGLAGWQLLKDDRWREDAHVRPQTAPVAEPERPDRSA